MLLLFILSIILFVLWTMLKCASIYDEIEGSYEYKSKNKINLNVTKK